MPSTSYTWAVESAEGCEEGTFITSDIGLPVVAPEAVIGRTFEIAVDQICTNVSFILFFEPPFWIRIDSLDGSTAQVTLVPTQPPGSTDEYQYTCEASTTAPGSWDGTRLHLEGDALPLPVGVWDWSANNDSGIEPPQAIALRAWSLDLVVHPNGLATPLDEMTFTADTRNLGEFFTYANGAVIDDCQPAEPRHLPQFGQQSTSGRHRQTQRKTSATALSRLKLHIDVRERIWSPPGAGPTNAHADIPPRPTHTQQLADVHRIPGAEPNGCVHNVVFQIAEGHAVPSRRQNCTPLGTVHPHNDSIWKAG